MHKTKKSYQFNSITLIKSFVFLILLHSSISTNRQLISTQIPLPISNTNKIPLSYATADKNKSKSITFPEITF